MRKHFIVGTAGHVDHGKTTLIRALTGIDTDRLPEEKARGLSIDLGFAHLALPGDVVAGIVDVPGHERFLKNMLAGVGGYDVGMLVVDAQEGVMPQTREHVEILELLKTPLGVVVLTKADLVDDDFLQLVQEDLQEFLHGTFLENAPCLAVSAKTGKGLDQLRLTLGQLLGSARVRGRQGNYRLPVDRSFHKAGFGTVVTGSLWSGSLHKGDRVVILPQGEETRVRGLQVHGQETEEAVAGQRVAVNLSGVEPGSVKRGMLLASPDWLTPTLRLDLRVQVSPRAPRPLKHRTRVRVYAGTSEVFGRALLLEEDEILPAKSGLVQLTLDEPLVVLRSDRVIIRDFTASYTIGGGEVLDPLAQPHKRKDEAVLAQIHNKEQGDLCGALLAKLPAYTIQTPQQCSAAMQLPAADLEPLLQQLQQSHLAARLGKGWALQTSLEEVSESLIGLLASLQQQAPWKSGWRKEELLKILNHDHPKFAEEVFTYLVEHRQFQESGRLFCLPGHQARLSKAQQVAADRVLQRLLQEGFSPSAWSDMAALERVEPALWKAIETYLVETGKVVKLPGDIVFLRETVEKGKEVLSGLASPFTASAAREALGTSRKFAIPLLEHYDQSGFTQRQGEQRTIRGGVKQ